MAKGGEPQPLATAGYSGTPLSKKLGLREGCRWVVVNPPSEYWQWLTPLPAAVQALDESASEVHGWHLFVSSRGALEAALPVALKGIRRDGMIWVSWPKKASRVVTDLTEDGIREIAIPLGLVDIKVCAVDATWSGLKLVVRKELR